MASTYSGNLAIELIGTGDQAGTWGNTTNTNLGTALEQAIIGSANVTMTSGTNTAITIAQNNTFQAARSLRLNLVGTITTTPYLYVPAISKQYIVNNGLANAVIISNGSNAAATGVAVQVPANKSVMVYNDGINVALASTYFDNVTLSNTTFTANTAAGSMASLTGFTTTATANSNTTLDSTSSYYQIFTGTGNQNVALPVVSTLSNGWTFHICNNSTGSLSIRSSGANVVITVPSQVTAMCTAILTSGTTEASWEAGLTDFSTATGNGSVVLANNATIGNVSVNAYTEGITLGYGNTGSANTINISTSTIITANLSASCTFTMPTATAGKSFVLMLKTGAGSLTGTFTGVRWNNGNTAPTITATANRLDIATFVADGSVWYGTISQNYVP